jgi:uncharacterized protein
MMFGIPTQSLGMRPAANKAERCRATAANARIWVDLDNSPHVPFFVPIIEELEKRSYSVVVTARDCFQVRELAEFFHLNYELIGHHSGKNRVRKAAGLCGRALRLIPIILREKPILAVSHGSRSQLIVATCLGIPSIHMGDYEFLTPWAFIHPTWHMCPELIPNSALPIDSNRILKYPGIKEDVYVTRFAPESGFRSQLGLQERDMVVTIRPPATEAHYHDQRSEELFEAVVEFLGKNAELKLVALPRNERQAIWLKKRWPALFANGAMRIPPQVVDGRNLIWHSDLVVSGGGTMNREAAALGVPVCSVFRGKIGAVDRYLSERGRLTLLESIQDVQTKIRIARRDRPASPQKGSDVTLRSIVDQIVAVAQKNHPLPGKEAGIEFGQLASAVGKAGGEFGGPEVTR